MPLPLRRFVFWMHLVAGVAAGVIILVMSVTGIILAYEKQIARWADGVSGAPVTAGQARLPLDDLVVRATSVHPGVAPGTVTVRRAPDAPVEVNFGQKGSVFVDAYTGAILGTGSARARAFFRSVTEWPRSPARPAGRTSGPEGGPARGAERRGAARETAGWDSRPYLTLDELRLKAEQRSSDWTILSARLPMPRARRCR